MIPSIDKSLENLRPCAYIIHNMSLKSSSDICAHGVQLFQYPAQVIDHLIRAVAAPIFSVLLCIKIIKKEGFGAEFFLTFPLGFGYGLYRTARHVMQAIFHAILPISTLQAVCNGKEAAKMFAEKNEAKDKILGRGNDVEILLLPRINAEHSDFWNKNIAGDRNFRNRLTNEREDAEAGYYVV